MSDPGPCNRRVSRKWGSATLALRSVKVRERLGKSAKVRTRRAELLALYGPAMCPAIDRRPSPYWKGLESYLPTSTQVEETIGAMCRDGEAFRITHGDGSSHLVSREAVYAGVDNGRARKS